MKDWILLNLSGDGSAWFWAMAQFVAIVVTLPFIYRQVRLQAQANMLQTLEALAQKWDSPTLRAARSAACKAHPRIDHRIGAIEYEVAGFFEDLALYFKRGVFDIDIIWERWSYFIEHYWAMFKPSIESMRGSTRDDTWFSCFEYLSLHIERTSRRRRVPFAKSAREIQAFIVGELEQIPEQESAVPAQPPMLPPLAPTALQPSPASNSASNEERLAP